MAITQGRRKNKNAAPKQDNAFLSSLESLTADELAKADITDKKPNIFALIRFLALLFCSGVFIYCAVMLAGSFLDYKKAGDFYNNLSEDIFGNTEDLPASENALAAMTMENSSQGLYSLTEILTLGVSGQIKPSASGSNNLQLARMKTKLAELSDVNPDVFAWIKIDGTNISYPVVKGKNNDYYLDHGADGNYLRSGSIFADYRCSTNMDNNRNTVFYGHNMTNDTMFGDVEKFLDENFFRNTLIYIYTKDGIYVYKPFSVFSTRSNFQYFRVVFVSDEDYLNFVTEMHLKSRFATDQTFDEASRIITLSTCTNLTTNGRYCLQAVLIDIQK